MGLDAYSPLSANEFEFDALNGPNQLIEDDSARTATQQAWGSNLMEINATALMPVDQFNFAGIDHLDLSGVKNGSIFPMDESGEPFNLDRIKAQPSAGVNGEPPATSIANWGESALFPGFPESHATPDIETVAQKIKPNMTGQELAAISRDANWAYENITVPALARRTATTHAGAEAVPADAEQTAPRTPDGGFLFIAKTTAFTGDPARQLASITTFENNGSSTDYLANVLSPSKLNHVLLKTGGTGYPSYVSGNTSRNGDTAFEHGPSIGYTEPNGLLGLDHLHVLARRAAKQPDSAASNPEVATPATPPSDGYTVMDGVSIAGYVFGYGERHSVPTAP